MNEKEKKRIQELLGKQNQLQVQCYLMKKGLEVNEQELARIAAVLAEYETGGNPPQSPFVKGEEQPQKKEKPDA